MKLIALSISVVALLLLSPRLTSGQVPRHGIQEFNASGTFEVPAGVFEIVLELWGAGGGGGGGRSAGVGAGPGGSGEETFLRIGTRTVLSAKGGQGGRLATADNGRVGEGGAGGDSTATAWMLVRSGSKGYDGQTGGHTEWNSVPGGVGGAAILGTVAPSGSFGGSGGSGGVFGQGGGNGADGGRGFAIVAW